MASKLLQRFSIRKGKLFNIGESARQSCGATCSMSTIFAKEHHPKKHSKTPVHYSRRYLQCKIENNIVKSPFPDVDIPEISLAKYMYDSYAQHNHRIAISCAHTNHSYKFGEINAYARLFGSSLIRNGFKPGDVLGIHSFNSPEYLIAIMGAIAVGGIVAPFNPGSPTAELIREFSVVKPKILLCGADCLDEGLRAAQSVDSIQKVYCFSKKGDCPTIKEMFMDDGSLYKFHDNVNVKNDPAFIMFTSGSTGLPKAAMLTHYNVIANLHQNRAEGLHKVEKKSVTIGVLPFTHSFGLFFILLNYSINGGRILALQKFEPESFMKKVVRLNVNRLNLVPYLVNFLSTSPLVEKFNLSKIRHLVAGAAPMPTSFLGSLRKRLPNAIISQGYGMTELSPVSHNHPDGGVDIASVGYPIANTESKIIDIETGADLGINESGEILVRGPQVMKGYLNDPQSTKKTIDGDGWLHTGDMAYYDDEGKFYIVGRIKELIKYKGLQVSPKEIENILIDHPAIIDATVFGIPNADCGELPAAVIVLHQNYPNFTIKELHAYLKEKVSIHKQLKGGVKIVDHIPRNSIGKTIISEALKIFH